MKKIEQLVEEFNKLDSCVKLKLESGGLARITIVDHLVLEDSKIIPSKLFFSVLDNIAKKLGVEIVSNNLQTTIRIK